MAPTLTSARVAVVSGKGGVGKTTVAAALAVAAARTGKQVLLAEIEDRRALAPMFGIPEVGYVERALGPNLAGIEVEADDALVEYLQHFYGIPRLSRALVKSKVVDFATNTAPGLRDILLIGKIKESEQRRPRGVYAYDLIVIDAPPTGRLPRFLDAPRAVAALVRSGPIKRQAEGVLDMVRDPKRLQVILVTQPEEMPARETAEAVETLGKMDIALGPIVINGVWKEMRALGKDPYASLRAAAADAGLGLGEEAIKALADVSSVHARRARNQRKVITELKREVDLPQVTLPFLFNERMARPELDVLATQLEGAL
ncbi:MAG: ArsA family ATPase [Actinomycetota bacterium]